MNVEHKTCVTLGTWRGCNWTRRVSFSWYKWADWVPFSEKRVLLFIHRTSANICFVKQKRKKEWKEINKKVQIINVVFVIYEDVCKKIRLFFLSQIKRVECPLSVRWQTLCLMWRNLSFLFTSVGRMEREMDWGLISNEEHCFSWLWWRK